jgi:preprotein translocase subunit SecA
MAMWSWLTGRRSGVRIADDTVWLSTEAKLKGLAKEMARQQDGTGLVLVVAHFPATLAEVREQLAKNALGHAVLNQKVTAADVAKLASQRGRSSITLVLSEALVPDEFPAPIVPEAEGVSIVVAERHFLGSHDERIVTFAKGLSRPCRLGFHMSLEDPLLKAFAGDWVRNLLAGLGMTEASPIKSSMIGKRIKDAQAQLAKRATDDRTSASAEEWVRLNLAGES